MAYKMGTVPTPPNPLFSKEGVPKAGELVVESRLSLFCLQRGFTLIELLVVISILSITLSFVVPRLMGKEEAELKSASRKMLYAARRLSDEAMFRKEKRVLNIDIETGEYREGDEGKRIKLPNGIQVENIVLGKEEITKGAASIAFFPSGLRDEAEITLTGKGKEYTVAIPALGERFEIREGT